MKIKRIYDEYIRNSHIRLRISVQLSMNVQSICIREQIAQENPVSLERA